MSLTVAHEEPKELNHTGFHRKWSFPSFQHVVEEKAPTLANSCVRVSRLHSPTHSSPVVGTKPASVPHRGVKINARDSDGAGEITKEEGASFASKQPQTITERLFPS